MSFKDVFKKSFVEGFATSEVSGKVVLAGLGFAAVLGHDDDCSDSHHAVQCGDLPGHGWRIVYCPVPYGYQRSAGSHVPVLVHQRWYYLRCRNGSDCSDIVRCHDSRHSVS